MGKIPYIGQHKGVTTLFVKEEPYLAFAGEIHNSSAANLDYMKSQIWPAIQDLNLNTLIVPLYWELIEDEENKFDFTLVHGLIEQARENHIHLVFLWFGLWKNAESMYVPRWMKQDSKKYFHARKINGEPLNTISPLCEAAVEKDAYAFSKIMEYIRGEDEEENTVIVMQVENEIGLLGTERDYCEEANTAFQTQVPDCIAEEFGRNGNWEDIFGQDAGEYFMAYSFAKAVEKITGAGREKYPLPCYTNAWLKQYPWRAGTYPSGGPIKEMHKVWKKVAPSLFCLAPDIYVPYVAQVMEEYTSVNNPLFIPEVRKDAVTASYAMYAFANFNAICYAPFSIEEYGMNPEMIHKPPMEVMRALNIDPTAFEIEGCSRYLAKSYEIIREIKPLLLEYRNTDKLKSFVKMGEYDFGRCFSFEKYDIKVSYDHKQSYKPIAGGMIFEIEPDLFYIIGMMCSFEFLPKFGTKEKVEVLKLEEGQFSNGEWIAKRRLNGDEKMMLHLSDMPECYCISLFQYE